MIFLDNDKERIEIARSHGIKYWWMTTLLLRCTKDGSLAPDEATDGQYGLVDEGTNLYPKEYAQV